MISRVVFVPLCVTLLLAEPYVSELLTDRIEAKYGSFAKNRFALLNKIMDDARGQDELRQLEIINDFYNGVPYLSDEKNYKSKDYWATPLEFLGRDRGDCEDYVIAKYFALKFLGIDTNKLYFTYVRSRKFNAPHMVLTYFATPDSIPLVLDNFNYRIFPANERKDLLPVYNFNGDNLYIAQQAGYGEKVDRKQSFKQWDVLLHNIQRQKL
ncbi:transglutaminase-like cysteine peptidase [Sulfurimonas sp. HSL3-7]|uniref:transglutaminase-like cysteine peptidase n=1 Tax=Sulfonitrofixus jiaomeiensis TaxID=3131938 RepID=UPI0031F7D403